jgi:transcriptional regulator with XRE-family HTH domain
MNIKPIIFPKMRRLLGQVGVNITLARLRRKFTSEQVAERAGISLEDLAEIEHGSPDISIGMYTVVLRVLNLDKDIYRIAEDDVLGRKLQDIELINKNIK